MENVLKEIEAQVTAEEIQAAAVCSSEVAVNSSAQYNMIAFDQQ